MLLAYTTTDSVSAAAAERLKPMLGMVHDADLRGHRHFSSGPIEMLELSTPLVDAQMLDSLGSWDLIVFLSRHRSAKGVPAFTVHAEGNWGQSADLGGTPGELGMAAPVQMLGFLRSISSAASMAGAKAQVVYEATHHGPLLRTPSFFAEMGGSEEAMSDPVMLDTFVSAVADFVNGQSDPTPAGKVAVYLGGTHYPAKATAMALGKGYAFAHIMPKHFVAETGMLAQAFERSRPRPTGAVIEWKSINAVARDKLVQTLDLLGFEYERA